MSVLRLYDQVGLTTMISIDGGFENPDEETAIDGTAGATKQLELWVAVEQTTLAAAITTTSETIITLTAARFADTDYSTIIIDSEKMLITAGHGTTSLTVVRGHNGTTAATHSSAAAVRAAYDCTNISIDCVDETGTDESGWMTYCNDNTGTPTGSWEAPHTISNIAYNASVAIWRRLIVPALTAAEYKHDLIHRITCDIAETS